MATRVFRIVSPHTITVQLELSVLVEPSAGLEGYVAPGNGWWRDGNRNDESEPDGPGCLYPMPEASGANQLDALSALGDHSGSLTLNLRTEMGLK